MESAESGPIPDVPQVTPSAEAGQFAPGDPDVYVAQTESPVATTAKPPGVAETISRAFDLSLAASRSIRHASLYIGFVTLLIAGPAVVLFMAIVRDLGGLDQALELMFGRPGSFDRPEDAASGLRFAAFLGFIGLIAISLEGQILAATIVGGAATGRKIGLRGALRLSRRVFWSVAGAAFAVGILDQIVSRISGEVIYAMTSSVDGANVAATLIAGLVTMPFAYYQSSIILGGVGWLEALRRSTWLARVRWRLALLVALAGTALSFVEIFALGAGLDLVARFGAGVGLGLDGSAEAAFATVGVVLLCVIAIGSLVVTIAALAAAPQVYVFYRLTRYDAGLDRVKRPAGDTAKLRLITRPMLALIVAGTVFGLLGLISL